MKTMSDVERLAKELAAARFCLKQIEVQMTRIATKPNVLQTAANWWTRDRWP